MRTGPFKTRTWGSFSSLPLAAWSVRQVSAPAGLSKHLLIEKTYCLNPKLSLSSWNISSYGPIAACLALTLRQTHKEENHASRLTDLY